MEQFRNKRLQPENIVQPGGGFTTNATSQSANEVSKKARTNHGFSLSPGQGSCFGNYQSQNHIPITPNVRDCVNNVESVTPLSPLSSNLRFLQNTTFPEKSDLRTDISVFLSPHFLRKHAECIKLKSRILSKENVPPQSKQSMQPVFPTSRITPLSPLSSLGARNSAKSEFVKETIVLGKSHFVRKHAECIEPKENVPPQKTHIAQPSVPTSPFSGRNCDTRNEQRIDGACTKPNVTSRNRKISRTLPTITKENKVGRNCDTRNEKRIHGAHKKSNLTYRNRKTSTTLSRSTKENHVVNTTRSDTSVHDTSNVSTFVDKGKKAIELEHDQTDFDSDVSEVFSDQENLEDFIFETNEEIADRLGCPPRKLLFNENEGEDPPYDINNDNEFSYIAGMHSDQSDGDSEAEMDEDVHIPSYEDMSAVDTVVKEYASLGPPNVKCSYCDAWMWKEERVNKSVVRGTPVFSLCCAKGQIKLPKEPPTPSFLWQLHTDKAKGQRFKDGMRLYNSIFAFTSTGGRVDNSINNGGAPYIYRLNGQNHHLFGSLIPPDGEDPKFCQLYIYDTENEISNRLRWVNVDGGDPVDVEIIEGLSAMLDETNELVKEFRTARDHFESDGVQDLEIRLKVCRAENGRENHVGPSDEVAGIMVGDIDDTDGSRDIIIHSHIKGLERISDIHPKLMALQYPLLFPHGGDGFHKKIPFGKVDKKSLKKREMISQKEYYSYKFQVRINEGLTPRLGGRLYQQYVVDTFSTIEQARLWWFRTNQTTLRSELYSNIQRNLNEGTSDSANTGKGFILPAGFVGSRRYMQQNFQDALAVCRHIGHPDIFLTMTTNPLWDEVIQMMKLLPYCQPQNSPDVMARVFRLKLDQLIDDIKKKNYFGTCLGVMYVVEFQKRGLPHVHMLIWLDAASKLNLQANVDKFVSAEIPDPEIDPVGYVAVNAFMAKSKNYLKDNNTKGKNNYLNSDKKVTVYKVTERRLQQRDNRA
ncbi:hypothetical protein AgCh_026978 [Apium graveolens]